MCCKLKTMAFFLTLVYLLAVWDLSPSNCPLVSTSSYVSNMQDTYYSGTNANVAGHLQQPQSPLVWALNLWLDPPRDLPKFQNFFALYNLTLSLKERLCLVSTYNRLLQNVM